MAGRPTDYQESYNEQAEKLCKLGATDAELADFFDIAESTLNNWKSEYPEFMESIKRVRHLQMQRWPTNSTKGLPDIHTKTLILNALKGRL